MVNAVQTPTSRTRSGFTLIELLVVMAVIATLLSLVAPRYFDSVDKAKEATLKTNLRLMREAIDKRFGDTGQYPANLGALVTDRYLYAIPEDPITERSDTWIEIPYPDRSKAGVFDVRSGATDVGRNGVSYAQW